MTRRIEIGCVVGLGLLLLVAPRAAADTYSVIQCGWGAGAEAGWRGAASHFRGLDCGSGALRSSTRSGNGTVSRGDGASWRWTAPPGTSITGVRGAWWRTIRDRFEQRLYGLAAGGIQLLRASGRSGGPEGFAVGSPDGWRAFDATLECRRSGGRCAQRPASSASLAGLVLTLRDLSAPRVAASGALAGGAWLAGTQPLGYRAGDTGSGVAVVEAAIDGERQRIRQPCAAVNADGALRGTRMRPCDLARGGVDQIPTARLADGAHRLRLCAEDFAGNRGCEDEREIHVDNTPPGPPLELALAGGDGWRASNGFAVGWRNPGQDGVAPLAATWSRLRSATGGFDSGPRQVAGVAGLGGVTVPSAGEYELSVWLGDAAGNADEATAQTVHLRFDDVPPAAAFADAEDPAKPEEIVAPVSDLHSGVQDGEILYRHLGDDDWIALSTELRPGATGLQLVARFPSERVPPGTYELRAEALDRAGNRGSSELRADGRRMFVEAPMKTETVLRARISGTRGGDGRTAATAYGEPASIAGSLRTVAGDAVAGAPVTVHSRFDGGASPSEAAVVTHTDSGGRFRLALAAGPSRVIDVSYGGSDTLAADGAPRLRQLSEGAVTLRASARRVLSGRSLVLAGNVGLLGVTPASAGKLVAIEFFDRRRHAWQPAALVRAGAGGRFSFAHRFSRAAGGARIVFRAKLPSEAGWPYEPAASSPLAVSVRR
jgi:hypothetical protein